MSADNDPLAQQNVPVTRVPLTLERVALATCMAALALITAANVLTRYLTNISLAFTEEYSVVLMVAVTLIGSAYAFAGARHVRIDFFVNLLSPRSQRVMELISLMLVLMLFLLIVYHGARLTWDDYRFGVLTSGLGHPQWVYVATLPALSLLIVARVIGRIWRVWHRTLTDLPAAGAS